jgi:hypothetical protein
MNCLTNRWLNECVHLAIVNYNFDNSYVSSFVVDGSLVRFPFNLFSKIL